jgi:N-methylhydantoinase A/oxoprolinase/acetone carboxylase beta subunit
MPGELHLGVDVGGTNTDAVIIGRRGALIAKAKVPTGSDVRRAIERAIRLALSESDARPDQIRRVMLGTTQAANAILERRGLQKVGVIRLGYPLTTALPPLATWPADLRAAVSVGETVVAGGSDYDGAELGRLDRDAVARFAASIGDAFEAVAITGVFSPVSADHELEAAEIVRREIGAVNICLSHEIGTLGLIERENATVLNAALTGVVTAITEALEDGLTRHGLQADMYLAQNDGTLVALEAALRFPILTIASGPANSMRGAAFLSGEEEAVVIDVGGTTADIGVLVRGFPSDSLSPVTVGDVETNFRMPEILSLRIGGGTRIEGRGSMPELGASVGSRLTSEALVFGGSTATLTDAAVELGRMSLDGRAVPAGWRNTLAAALAKADALIAEGIDRMRLTSALWPLVVVGGAGALVPSDVDGVSRFVRPDHYDVANAIGAAIAPVSGYAERVCPSRPDRKAAAIQETCDDAFARAIQAGADPRQVTIADVDEVPLSYLLDPAVRVRARAIGPLLDVPPPTSPAVPAAVALPQGDLTGKAVT